MLKIIVLCAVSMLLISCDQKDDINPQCHADSVQDTLKLIFERQGDHQVFKQSKGQWVELYYKNSERKLFKQWSGRELGIFTLSFKDSLNKAFSTSRLSIDLCSDCINLPKYVTANGDGINDHFEPADQYCTLRLDVQNELGEQVDTELINWERLYPEGNYVFICEMTTLDGRTIIENGSFRLLH